MTDKLKDLQLKLLIALDFVRDSIDEDSDPLLMFRQITLVLKKHFEADASAILLIEPKTGDTELVSTHGMPQDMGLDLCKEAIHFTEPETLSKSAWHHTLGLRIYIEREMSVVGSIVLARDDLAFSEDAVELLNLAESQIDSAVIQARTLWRLAERNRELEAIYQIDRLRDDAIDEDILFSNFSKLLVKEFNASYCQIIIHNVETGILETRYLHNTSSFTDRAFEPLLEYSRDVQTTTILPASLDFDRMQFLAAPFIVSGQRLGAVIVGRNLVYSINDTRLMIAMVSQMDSAIAKSRMSIELAKRTRELEAIYRIDQIRDREHDFDEMLRLVLVELCQVVSSELGYLLLYNSDKQEAIELRTSSEHDITQRPEYMNVIDRTSREALESEQIVTYNFLDTVIKSIVSIPLILNSQVMGVFGSINSHNPNGFSHDDGRLLSAITSQVDSAVFERLERRRIRKVLSRSVDPQVLEAILTRADDSLLAGERVVLTVLFADLRNSTQWAERIDPEELVNVLNTFLGKMTDVIFQYGGTLDKFVGDEVIALFGSPAEMPDHALNAAQCAIDMQIAHQKLRKEFLAHGKDLPLMGVGISTGEVIAGEFGPPIRTDFTAMGRSMNLGARLCGAASGDQIIISENTYLNIQDRCRVRELEPQTYKGIDRIVKSFELLSVHE